MKKRKMLDFFWRISSCHIVSYFIMGILALIILNYKERYGTGSLALFMRPTHSPWVALGPSLQIVRAFIFTVVLWPLKNVFIEKDKGWLKLWGLFIGLAILGTSGPTPGSFEGIVYTKISIVEHLLSLPEIIIQTLLFSLGVFYWYKNPNKIWDIVMSILVLLIGLMSMSGFLLASNLL